MTNAQRIYHFIAAMGGVTVAEILEASRWSRDRVFGALADLQEWGAIRHQNINGVRHYVPC